MPETCRVRVVRQDALIDWVKGTKRTEWYVRCNLGYNTPPLSSWLSASRRAVLHRRGRL
jgi:hypothetical protein